MSPHPTNNLNDKIFVIKSFFLVVNQITKLAPATGTKVLSEGWGVLSLKKTTEYPIKNKPIDGNILFNKLYWYILEKLICIYANKEPASNSQNLVCKK